MNTPDTPEKSKLDKRLILVLCIAIICGRAFSDLILHVQPWWLEWIVGGAATVALILLGLWIIGRFRRA